MWTLITVFKIYLWRNKANVSLLLFSLCYLFQRFHFVGELVNLLLHAFIILWRYSECCSIYEVQAIALLHNICYGSCLYWLVTSTLVWHLLKKRRRRILWSCSGEKLKTDLSPHHQSSLQQDQNKRVAMPVPAMAEPVVDHQKRFQAAVDVIQNLPRNGK